MTTVTTPVRRPLQAAALAGALALTLAACGDDASTTTAESTDEAITTTAAEDAPAQPDATATVHDAEGAELGTVQFFSHGTHVQVQADFTGMDEGFYGLHIHSVGLCEPDEDPTAEDASNFTSAAGHLGSDEAEHPDHAGDLPALLVMSSGEAALGFSTDRFTLEDLTDEDGTAVMVHSGPDNYANIPERYLDGGEPDADTLNAGDAGSRLACGVIEAG